MKAVYLSLIALLVLAALTGCRVAFTTPVTVNVRAPDATTETTTETGQGKSVPVEASVTGIPGL
jgi:hypothetical protein